MTFVPPFGILGRLIVWHFARLAHKRLVVVKAEDEAGIIVENLLKVVVYDFTPHIRRVAGGGWWGGNEFEGDPSFLPVLKRTLGRSRGTVTRAD